jgi:hypothetical protein
VLAKFFGGDLDYAQKSHTKHLSFAALADHSELNVGKSTLWYAVAMLGQLRQLPKDIAGALPFSHHKLLLTVKDPEQKLELAKEAVATGLSKRKLEDRVRGVRGERWTGAGKPGRQALPPWAKGIGTIKKAVESAMATGVTVGEGTGVDQTPPRRPRGSAQGPESLASHQDCRIATACRLGLAYISSMPRNWWVPGVCVVYASL